MPENNRIELKKQLTEHFEKEVVAFLNYLGGGVIYLGIDDEGNVIGVKNSNKLQLQLKDRIKNTLLLHAWDFLSLWKKPIKTNQLLK